MSIISNNEENQITSEEGVFKVGEIVYAQNRKYSDGTCLMKTNQTSKEEDNFNEHIVKNDEAVEITEIDGEMAKIKANKTRTGWIRTTNLSRQRRQPNGLHKHIVRNEIVTPDPEYCKGMRLFGVGIKQDLLSSKFAKGDFNLISPLWWNALSSFVHDFFSDLRPFVAYCYNGFGDSFYLANCSQFIFNIALSNGFRGQDDLDSLLCASFLLLASAEIDDFPFLKYSKEERTKFKEEFFRSWMEIDNDSKKNSQSPKIISNGKYAYALNSCCDFGKIPFCGMDRFGLNSSLSALKYDDPLKELREGFKMSSRVDSLIRHYLAIQRRDFSEDHTIHAVWNLHALYHNLICHPEMNNLSQYKVSHSDDKAIKRYSPTTSLDKIERNTGSSITPLKYDWNEGVISPPQNVLKSLEMFISSPDKLKWYPHLKGGHILMKKILGYVGVDGLGEENLLITNGSDEALHIVCECFLDSTKTILIPTPTYEHFVVVAGSTNARVCKFTWKEDIFKNSIPELLAQIDYYQPHVVYLVSPNNPTGTMFTQDEVSKLLKMFPKIIFIIDEAYFEFGDGSTSAPLVLENKNIIVTRTSSKAFCLASIRCGYLLGNKCLIEKLLGFYNPKSVNEIAQICFSGALDVFHSYYKPYIEDIQRARSKFISDLKEKKIDVRSGGWGNFVCIKIPSHISPGSVCSQLEDLSIFVRDINERLPGYVRITIGSEMERVVSALVEIIGKLSKKSD